MHSISLIDIILYNVMKAKWIKYPTRPIQKKVLLKVALNWNKKAELCSALSNDNLLLFYKLDG